ncbi:hypothetical protein NSK_004565 [Nannochloropsis salina CCMP1776]|uniref:FHA domain-containing protein n=1 Tax=Nannochloropsis salina CCMP1776 TaxID=1027361 RepID=A0A4D9CXP7_9STRA|nr:hypothetical protein NSK_004565 [Nannochloropsis salina CCMP1776]|eukprot:TFJ84092.1 hypothetical protein NSK_004565 [Nannochloropsis salina CCMP1776]
MSTQRFDYLVEENEAAERNTVPAVDECVISAHLTFSDMPGQRKGVHMLESGENTIGRAAGNKVILDHPSISERHAIISVVDDCMFIKDCGSTNRTWLWDAARGTFQPRSLARLRDGDCLRLGTLEAQLALHSTAKEEQRAAEGEARFREGREGAAAEAEAVPPASRPSRASPRFSSASSLSLTQVVEATPSSAPSCPAFVCRPRAEVGKEVEEGERESAEGLRAAEDEEAVDRTIIEEEEEEGSQGREKSRLEMGGGHRGAEEGGAGEESASTASSLDMMDAEGGLLEVAESARMAVAGILWSLGPGGEDMSRSEGGGREEEEEEEEEEEAEVGDDRETGDEREEEGESEGVKGWRVGMKSISSDRDGGWAVQGSPDGGGGRAAALPLLWEREVVEREQKVDSGRSRGVEEGEIRVQEGREGGEAKGKEETKEEADGGRKRGIGGKDDVEEEEKGFRTEGMSLEDAGMGDLGASRGWEVGRRGEEGVEGGNARRELSEGGEGEGRSVFRERPPVAEVSPFGTCGLHVEEHAPTGKGKRMGRDEGRVGENGWGENAEEEEDGDEDSATPVMPERLVEGASPVLGMAGSDTASTWVPRGWRAGPGTPVLGGEEGPRQAFGPEGMKLVAIAEPEGVERGTLAEKRRGWASGANASGRAQRGRGTRPETEKLEDALEQQSKVIREGAEEEAGDSEGKDPRDVSLAAKLPSVRVKQDVREGVTSKSGGCQGGGSEASDVAHREPPRAGRAPARTNGAGAKKPAGVKEPAGLSPKDGRRVRRVRRKEMVSAGSFLASRRLSFEARSSEAVPRSQCDSSFASSPTQKRMIDHADPSTEELRRRRRYKPSSPPASSVTESDLNVEACMTKDLAARQVDLTSGRRFRGEQETNAMNAPDIRRVAVSCVEPNAEMKRQLRALGLSLVDDLRQADLLIAGDGATGVAARRTAKVMSALSLGLALVDYSWLRNSAKLGVAQDPRGHPPSYKGPKTCADEMTDDNTTVQPSASVKAPFLEGWAVLAAFKSFGVNGVPSKGDLRLIVECAGGIFFDKPKDLESGRRKKTVRSSLLILSNECSMAHKTLGIKVRRLAVEQKAAGMGVHYLEALLAGAMKQRLDLLNHVLWQWDGNDEEEQTEGDEKISSRLRGKENKAVPARASSKKNDQDSLKVSRGKFDAKKGGKKTDSTMKYRGRSRNSKKGTR